MTDNTKKCTRWPDANRNNSVPLLDTGSNETLMKKLFTILALLFALTIKAAAQNETPADTLSFSLPDNVKLFGNFMLDMHLLMPPKLPAFNVDPLNSDQAPDFNALFQLPGSATYSTGYVYNSYDPLFGGGLFSSPNYLKGASFKLGGNTTLNTYGQYDMYGRKVPNPGALPWEKNNFVGGMELKFNKNFGVRIEVQRRQNPMYPY